MYCRNGVIIGAQSRANLQAIQNSTTEKQEGFKIKVVLDYIKLQKVSDCNWNHRRVLKRSNVDAGKWSRNCWGCTEGKATANCQNFAKKCGGKPMISG